MTLVPKVALVPQPHYNHMLDGVRAAVNDGEDTIPSPRCMGYTMLVLPFFPLTFKPQCTVKNLIREWVQNAWKKFKTASSSRHDHSNDRERAFMCSGIGEHACMHRRVSDGFLWVWESDITVS
uniref:Uncharacterized protein n=1 Tax=Eutreptiella gymnastica TaxID=73025 RepID=A0A7S1I1L0_9EUGL